MRILVLNCGSSSLKFTLFDMPTGEEIASGLVDRLRQPEVAAQWKSSGREQQESVSVTDHETAVAWVARNVILKSEGLPVAGVGHRIVHGGDTYGDSIVITETVEADSFPKGPPRSLESNPLQALPAISGTEALWRLSAWAFPSTHRWD
jgi:acetate kinase